MTSHYGYPISSWNIYAAMSGQDLDLSVGQWSFDPKPGHGTVSGSWSVLPVGGLAKLSIQGSTAELSLVDGPDAGYPIHSFTISGKSCPLGGTTRLMPGSSVQCSL